MAFASLLSFFCLFIYQATILLPKERFDPDAGI
jgi:hypothetical protein